MAEIYNKEVLKTTNTKIVYDFEKQFRVSLEKNVELGKNAWQMSLVKSSGGAASGNELSLRFKEPEKVLDTLIALIKSLKDERPFQMKGVSLAFDSILFGSVKQKIERLLKLNLRQDCVLDEPQLNGDLTTFRIAFKPNNLKSAFSQDGGVEESSFRKFFNE